ncbi:hypothetical protein V7S43_014895 [Phytophthora oleae]|uniref:Uncharacterized protein n=1 Tax=Phytophthora oleae TaxID=2107226 RepID=A0ABD3F0Z0_9STRA
MPIALPTVATSSNPPVNSNVLSKTKMSAALPVALGSFAGWGLFQQQQLNPNVSSDDGTQGEKVAELSYEERSCDATVSISKMPSHPARVTVAWRGAR